MDFWEIRPWSQNLYTRRQVGPWGTVEPHFGVYDGTIRNSYRLYTVTIAISLTIRQQIVIAQTNFVLAWQWLDHSARKWQTERESDIDTNGNRFPKFHRIDRLQSCPQINTSAFTARRVEMFREITPTSAKIRR